MNELNPVNYDLLIIGGGPAGTGLLLKALKDGSTNKLFDRKIAVIEKSSELIKGSITQFKVNSDTFSDVFLECLEGNTGNYIDLSKLKNEIEFIKSYKGRSIPLNVLNNYYLKLGSLLKESLEVNKKCDFFMNSCVEKVIQNNDSTYEVFIDGRLNPVTTRNIVVSTGGHPQNLNDPNISFAGNFPLHKYQSKCIHSDTILKSGLPDDFRNQLPKAAKVVILGGSHSAFSVAHSLLHHADFHDLSVDKIKIWCNSPPKVYFNNIEEAVTNSYTDFTDQDICPVTKKLYRLAGLRMDGRQLYMQMLGLGGLKKEDRVQLLIYSNQRSELEADLNAADVIVLAYGYKFNIFPIYDQSGTRMKLKGETTNHWVNDNCELLDENSNVVSGIYASGLATGFIPRGELGGEPSFEGQTNGIWYYQNAVASRIIDNICNEHTSDLP